MYDEYEPKIDSILAESRKGGAGLAKASAMLDSSQDLANKISALIDRNTKYNTEIGDKSASNAQIAKHEAMVATVAIGALTLVLVALTCHFIRLSIINPVASAVNVANRMAVGDMTVQIEDSAKDEIGELMTAMKAMRDQLHDTVYAIQKNATDVKVSAKALGTSSGQMTSTIEQQSEAASAMAAAVEETTVSINHIADNANHALSVSQEAGRISYEGAEIIHHAVEEMHSIAGMVHEASETVMTLGQQSQQISAIVNVIKEVADQTNLLALNAAIEAARAGEQGRGFAVVADEVRKLAERTTQSTHEIGEMIVKIQGCTSEAVQRMDAMVEKVSNGQELANQAGDRILKIKQGAEQVMSAVNEISSALLEQGAASHEVAQNVERVARMSEENNTIASHLNTSATRLLEMADNMQTVVSKFKV